MIGAPSSSPRKNTAPSHHHLENQIKEGKDRDHLDLPDARWKGTRMENPIKQKIMDKPLDLEAFNPRWCHLSDYLT
jgi:hypothetical protein